MAERLENVLETVTEKEYPVIGQIKQMTAGFQNGFWLSLKDVKTG